MPFISHHYSKEYIIPNYIGESLSSFIPSLLALIQSHNRHGHCLSSSSSSSSLIHYQNGSLAANLTTLDQQQQQQQYIQPDPNYSVSTFFLLMLCLLLISTSGFVYLNTAQCALEERKNYKRLTNLNMSDLNDGSTTTTTFTSTSTSNDDDNDDDDGSLSLIHDDPTSTTSSTTTTTTTMMDHQIKLLLAISFAIAFINFGFMPSFLSYSTIPYGEIYFYLATNLSNLFLPCAIFLSIWSYSVSTRQIVSETSAALLLSLYILLVGIRSPCPPFKEQRPLLGGSLIVLSWILTSCLFTRVRLLIATKLQSSNRKNILLSFGLATLVGQTIGGSIGFVLIDILRLLKEKQPCSSSNMSDICIS